VKLCPYFGGYCASGMGECGVEVSIFKSNSNKELLKINSSDQIRNDFGKNSE
jgi:hypothetical protein